MLSALIQQRQLNPVARPLVPGQRKSDAFTAYAAVHELQRSLSQATK